MTRLAPRAHNAAVVPLAPQGEKRTTYFMYDLAGRLEQTQLPTVEVTTLTTTSGYAHTVTITPSSTATSGFTNLTVRADLRLGLGAVDVLGALLQEQAQGDGGNHQR